MVTSEGSKQPPQLEPLDCIHSHGSLSLGFLERGPSYLLIALRSWVSMRRLGQSMARGMQLLLWNEEWGMYTAGLLDKTMTRKLSFV